MVCGLLRAGVILALTLPVSLGAQTQDSARTRTLRGKSGTGAAADGGKEGSGKGKKAATRARKANTRALFAETVPIEFTLIANYAALARDRDTLSTKRFDGTLVIGDSAGDERRIPVKLRTRGHFRLLARNCRFVPIRIEFPDSGLKGTPFAGQRALKLGTHCQNGDTRYDTYTLREYLAYRIFNEITDRSFRARLARGTYVDSTTQRTLDTRVAMFIESEDDLAARMSARVRELRGALFDDVHTEQLLWVSLFQYGIGNTDFSLYALHNIRIALARDGTAYPVAYDFDFSGFVNAHYATPDPRMGIRNVRERKFRGPCRSANDYQVAAQRFIEQKPAVFSAIDAVPGFQRSDRSYTSEYLAEFYRTLEDPRRFKQEIVDSCEPKPGV